MDNMEKILALYKYIKELCSLKYTVVTDINKQYWTCFLRDIPVDPENIAVYYRDRVEEESGGSAVLLEVHKPEFQRCPEPPELIREWLNPGWDKFTNGTPGYKETLAGQEAATPGENAPYTEHFLDSDERAHAYDNWLTRWESWAKKQRAINDTRRFFAKLYQAYIDLGREAETLELMVGNGLIRDMGNRSINHPILLKRVKLEFDAKKNIIRICETDTDPELYALLLQEINDIDYSAVQALKADLHEYYYHPLDRNDTPDFLKALVHRLCSESKYLADEAEQPDHGDRITATFAPVYFIRKRIDGTLKAIEEIISNIETTSYVPGHLIDLVGGGKVEIPIDDHEPTIDEQLAALSGEKIDILLAKEANREQLEVAERIEQYNAVLVQGPPGTGKTHTIANLLGHFLAQGKNVLVTSHTSKALSVLKSQVPPAIQDLCVSVLDDTNVDMTRSVDGISEYLSRYTSREVKQKINAAMRAREEIIRRLAAVRRKIYAIKYREFEPIVYNGNGYSPSKIAEFVNRYEADLSYIPGKVLLNHPLPVNVDDLRLLYRSNAVITPADEEELACDLPDPQLLPSPPAFSRDMQAEAKAKQDMTQIGDALGKPLSCDFENDVVLFETDNRLAPFIRHPESEAFAGLEEYISSINTLDGWQIQAAVDGYKGGGYRQRWELLINLIEDTEACADAAVLLVVGRKISFADNIVPAKLKPHLEELREIFRRKGKISRIDLLFKKPLYAAYAAVFVNGNALSSEDDCKAVLQFLQLKEKRAQLAVLWNELMSPCGAPAFEELGAEPEEICSQRIPGIRRYLDWYNNEYTQLLSLLKAAGVNGESFFNYTDLDSRLTKIKKALCAVKSLAPLYIQAANAYLALHTIRQRHARAMDILQEGSRRESPLCNEMIKAIQAGDLTRYEAVYHELARIYEKYMLRAKRVELLNKIRPVAPDWAEEIEQRIGIHGNAVCPDTIEQAWQWRQFSAILAEITAEPFAALQKQSVALSKELRIKTAELAADNAWYHLLVRTEQNTDMRKALNGWKLTVTKIGKGTGKNAPMLRKSAREKMAKCQAAVPAWIMPVNKALENLDPTENCFDVIIIDEASQSDISALAIMYMAKKVIIVGDDKQVSPMAVGVDIDRMNALREMYIKDVIPNWDLYDAKTSLYDIAKTTYQPLMLREHFRCVPDIIGYSNKLSYDYKIKPLRDAGNCILKPPLVSYRVADGQRAGRRKINKKEAEVTVALLSACLEQPEYQHKTFGVISMLGDEQAKQIQQFIFRHIDPAVVEERRILCGNASHFQGDERDVVFLSLVDSNEGDGPLKLTGEGADQSIKQRYNVAASRAKDQLWIVHSLDYAKDLKSGDMRRDLLEYAENPQAYANLATEIAAHAESPFEESIGKALVAAGYHVIQQWPVGSFRIDMVVQCGGKRIAVECDGEQWHSGEEKIRRDMERQAILERMGWRFIRIRGSEYYQHPKETVVRIFKELDEYGIKPEKTIAQDAGNGDNELLSRVKIRAAQIMETWSEDDGGEPDAAYSWDVAPNGAAAWAIKIKKAAPVSKPATPVSRQPRHEEKTARSRKQAGAAKSIITEFEAVNIKYIDNRKQSGIVWAFVLPEQDELFKQILSRYDYRNFFERRGAAATNHQPAWRIMVGP